MKPSIGRVVHYVSRGSADGVYKPECRAAIITEVGGWVTMSGDDETDEWTQDGGRLRQLLQVWKDDACTLKVETPNGTFHNQVPYGIVPPLEDGTLAPWPPGTWHWPERVE